MHALMSEVPRGGKTGSGLQPGLQLSMMLSKALLLAWDSALFACCAFIFAACAGQHSSSGFASCL